MAILNITLNGLSADYKVEMDTHLSDRDIKHLAIEIIHSDKMSKL